CIDPGVCHGSFGTAHIFLRIYRMTGDKIFADAARAYLARGLGQRGEKHPRKHKGVAGVKADDVGPDQQPRWVGDPSYLTGGAGIALVLSAALAPDDDDSGWDRVLLMSTAQTSA